ncbi:hypothetical protein [Thermocatellispora tengchongensis]|uniref:hypothetical protein n=1 Tax=Thermocatellispora tengchongensis TaxID=1073253 RepID=UPI003639E9E8
MHTDREAAVEAALAALDLDTKVTILSGQDMWSLPAVPEIGLRPIVMSDGPVGVRGTHWSAADPAITLPSPTALAATWDPGLARRAGRLLGQEARRKAWTSCSRPPSTCTAARSAAGTSRRSPRTRC